MYTCINVHCTVQFMVRWQPPAVPIARHIRNPTGLSLILNENYMYHIAQKFGRENVWRICSFQAFGGKNFANE